MAPGEPPIFYWRHLDTSGTTAGQGRVLQELEEYGGDTDSGWEETSKSSASKYEEDSTLVEVARDTAVVDYSFFTPPQLPASAHLTTTPLIPTFG